MEEKKKKKINDFELNKPKGFTLNYKNHNIRNGIDWNVLINTLLKVEKQASILAFITGMNHLACYPGKPS